MIKVFCLIFSVLSVKGSPIGEDVDLEALIFGENNENMAGTSRDAIIGGEYTNIEEVPYLVQLYKDGSPICGATIISPEWVVTAAHCLENEEMSDYQILTGATFQGAGNYYNVVKSILHEEYQKSDGSNDIAVLQVNQPIEFNQGQNAIEISTTFPESGDVLQISGFGAELDGNDFGSQQLKVAYVPVIDKDECQEAYEDDHLPEYSFCAGILSSVDSCQGDSGGPAVIDEKLVGVVSSGNECASEIYPGVYTQILNYRQWIKNHTGV